LKLEIIKDVVKSFQKIINVKHNQNSQQCQLIEFLMGMGFWDNQLYNAGAKAPVVATGVEVSTALSAWHS
jgi:hypothetical protein